MKSKQNASRMYRLDSMKLNDTYYTEEGYLIDHPIVTTCGVFEYANPDGSIRRELRTPENVFSPESLATYEGKPVIVTHEAGEIDKDNVRQEQIGTMLSKGYQDGDNVRCKIVIHDTDALKRFNLRELSLGYSLNTINSPGMWNGQPYDCVQEDIEINHLAVVSEARAGDSARLNIDGRDIKKPVYLKGGPCMKTRNSKADAKAAQRKGRRADSDLTPEELEQAIALFKMQQAAGGSEAASDEGEASNLDAEEIVEGVRERKDRRDSEESNMDADDLIAEQGADIEALLGVIDELQAASDMTADEGDVPENADEDDLAEDENDVAGNADGEELAEDEGDDTNCDEDEETGSPSKNADSVDRKMRDYLDMVRIADRLNLDGVENMSLAAGRKRIIKKVKPKLNLDGKSDSYIKAAYDIAKQEVSDRKTVNDQRNTMQHKGTNFDDANGKGLAASARKNMINRLGGNR